MILRENCLSDNKHVNKHLWKISTGARLDFFGGGGGGGGGAGAITSAEGASY